MGDLADRESFREAAALVSAWVAEYRERVEEHPVLSTVAPGEVAELLDRAPPEQSESISAILEDVDRIILPGITHWNHPGFFAYFSSSSSTPGLLGEFLIGALGVNAMLWRTSPAATELELRVIDWLRQLVGLPAAFRGVILDTASTSSFTALLAAREAAGDRVRELGLAGRPEQPAQTVYVSEQAHSSLEKAAIAAGIGQRNVRRIPTDGLFRMDAGALSSAIAADLAAGLQPVMVCATIGTTSTTSVDPVSEVAPVCRQHGVWLHVDAAHAGPAAMLPEKRDLFAGWEDADSIVINPHKWMATTVDCSVLLFRDPDVFRASLALTPEYLTDETTGVVNLMDYGLALGRRFRALKLWLVLRHFGAEGLRAMLRGHIALADEFADWIADDDRFELVLPVNFATVCFRGRLQGAETDGGDGGVRAANELNRELLRRVNRSGSVFLSHTVLDDLYTLRLSVGGVQTERRHVRGAFELLGQQYDRIVSASGGIDDAEAAFTEGR